MTFTAFTTKGDTFQADSWAELLQDIKEWQGERTDVLRNPVQLTHATQGSDDWPVHFTKIASANKDFAVWFENDKSLVIDYQEHSTYWNNDGMA